MPKMKTHSGAAKRFKVKANGRIKRGNSNRSHILTKKTTKRKRHLRSPDVIDGADKPAVRKMLRIK